MHTWYKLRMQKTIAQYRNGDGEFYHHPRLKEMIRHLCETMQLDLDNVHTPGEKELAVAYESDDFVVFVECIFSEHGLAGD